MIKEPISYYRLAGTVRVRRPSDTFNIIQPQFDKYGITRIANVTGLDHIGIYNAVCIRPNSKSLSVSQGKGLTQELANLSAAMESIERWYAENVPMPLLKGSYNNLKDQYNLLSPQLIQDDFFNNSATNDLNLHWLDAIDIAKKEKAFVPYEYVSMDTANNTLAGLLLGVSSTGLASGNNYEEACCHALFELIERHSEYLWKNLDEKSKTQTQLDIQTIHSAENKYLLNLLNESGLEFAIWDMTCHLKIPAFFCLIKDANPFTGLTLFSGKGCHFNKDIALSRAITEAAQSRLTVISGARDDLTDKVFVRHPGAKKLNNGIADYCSRGSIKFGSIEGIFEKILSIFKKHDFNNVFVTELTGRLDSISVVKIIIPGMRNALRD